MRDPSVFKPHLRRQLAFIGRSCDSFDAGFRDEAIRIAVVIRVLLHTTQTSTSLLRHLGADETELLTTVSLPLSLPPGLVMAQEMVIHIYTAQFGGGGHQLLPTLDQASFRRFVPALDWWRQPVSVLNRTHATRRDIVLGAANKDGGAHIDPQLTPQYASLRVPGAYGFYPVAKDEEYVDYPIQDAHLVCLRQMGYELLSSPALATLAP